MLKSVFTTLELQLLLAGLGRPEGNWTERTEIICELQLAACLAQIPTSATKISAILKRKWGTPADPETAVAKLQLKLAALGDFQLEVLPPASQPSPGCVFDRGSVFLELLTVPGPQGDRDFCKGARKVRRLQNLKSQNRARRRG